MSSNTEQAQLIMHKKFVIMTLITTLIPILFIVPGFFSGIYAVMSGNMYIESHGKPYALNIAYIVSGKYGFHRRELGCSISLFGMPSEIVNNEIIKLILSFKNGSGWESKYTNEVDKWYNIERRFSEHISHKDYYSRFSTCQPEPYGQIISINKSTFKFYLNRICPLENADSIKSIIIESDSASFNLISTSSATSYENELMKLVNY